MEEILIAASVAATLTAWSAMLWLKLYDPLARIARWAAPATIWRR